MGGISFEQLVVGAVNFAFIGILPRVFFKSDGKFNLMWWVTALPLFISPAILVLNWMGYLPTPILGFEATMAQKGISLLLHCCSIGLISLTLGGHRVPLALWHQNNDAPKNIVTWGAYKRIRHPFYTSFLTCLLASNIACPHPLNVVILVSGFVVLNMTAAREEKRLSASEFGKEYQDYMKKTGRFFPRFGA